MYIYDISRLRINISATLQHFCVTFVTSAGAGAGGGGGGNETWTCYIKGRLRVPEKESWNCYGESGGSVKMRNENQNLYCLVHLTF